MKLSITALFALLILLPGLALAQDHAPVKAPVKALASPAPMGFSREKATDICTTAPRSEWLSQDEMKLLAQHRGYRIKTFKLAKGGCYEIYGFDREGRIVEAYFNPVTSRLVRQNIAH
ncbi:MAG: PepSY domain-containing protein [Gammaproteobacteria bacterium]|uniref:PepSY domain-containing protein n=1 Tax=Rhodoferax sp. TaxID=50421 RepID=UPI001DE16473|nr:PepSY domain-containing protein [Rhodoferax sp.]MBU3897433.1 PepSY domain-containing protein [Gammaproteobacteria bacterium]MBU3998480.1 PepSY domain-containing protein [Gammaproteobacteria bacterium]MBU4018779.1 PepSY domain-containing protein [Gammaproteobacteria bacterium]MBU4079734.1 PepSY domain-containing protein [Gammaproteobacteria bacterium]MBU4114948.1 PepSY domain-containing protein [Gammaproteobacteria bacterium]